MPVVLFILLVVGVAVGTASPLWIQGIILVAFIMYMNSNEVKGMEIGALLPLMMGYAFFIGVVLGDISYLFQTDFKGIENIPNPFVVGD